MDAIPILEEEIARRERYIASDTPKLNEAIDEVITMLRRVKEHPSSDSAQWYRLDMLEQQRRDIAGWLSEISALRRAIDVLKTAEEG